MSFSLSLHASASTLLIPSTFGDFGRAERDHIHKHTNILSSFEIITNYMGGGLLPSLDDLLNVPNG